MCPEDGTYRNRFDEARLEGHIVEENVGVVALNRGQVSAGERGGPRGHSLFAIKAMFNLLN